MDIQDSDRKEQGRSLLYHQSHTYERELAVAPLSGCMPQRYMVSLFFFTKAQRLVVLHLPMLETPVSKRIERMDTGGSS